MTRRLVSLLLPIALALFSAQFAHAQRGGGHGGGFSGAHVGGAPFGSGLRGGGFSSFSRSPGVFRSPSLSPYGGFRSGAFDGRGRYPYPRYNRGYRGPYFYGYGYGNYLVPNLVGYPFGYDPFFDYPFFDDDYGYDDPAPQAAPPPPQQEAYAAPEYYGPPDPGPAVPSEEPGTAYRPAYQGSSQIEPPPAQPATSLIFQDGRPTEQVHNYVLTKTTLYDLDAGNRKEIPLAELNLPATIAANRSAGIDFSPPASD